MSMFGFNGDISDYGPPAATGNPSGYGGGITNANRNALCVGLIVVVVLFMLVAGVIALRVSGEVVI